MAIPPQRPRAALPGRRKAAGPLACAVAGLLLTTSAASARPAAQRPAAALAIAAPVGASVRIDGRFVGTSPLAGSITAAPGQHTVFVSMNGFHPRRLTVDLEPGETEQLSVNLEMTDQRLGAWMLLGAGAAGIGTGIVLGTLSVVELRAARDIQQQTDGDLGEDDRRAYAAALDRRDDFRLGSGVAAGVGLVALLVGGPLYLLDPPALPSRDDGADTEGGSGAAGAARREAKRVDVRAAPIVTPHATGGSLSIRF